MGNSHSSCKNTSGKKTSGKKTSGKKTSGKKTSGKKTSGKKTSGKKKSRLSCTSFPPAVLETIVLHTATFHVVCRLAAFQIFKPFVAKRTQIISIEYMSSKSSKVDKSVINQRITENVYTIRLYDKLSPIRIAKELLDKLIKDKLFVLVEMNNYMDSAVRNSQFIGEQMKTPLNYLWEALCLDKITKKVFNITMFEYSDQLDIYPNYFVNGKGIKHPENISIIKENSHLYHLTKFFSTKFWGSDSFREMSFIMWNNYFKFDYNFFITDTFHELIPSKYFQRLIGNDIRKKNKVFALPTVDFVILFKRSTTSLNTIRPQVKILPQDSTRESISNWRQVAREKGFFKQELTIKKAMVERYLFLPSTIYRNSNKKGTAGYNEKVTEIMDEINKIDLKSISQKSGSKLGSKDSQAERQKRVRIILKLYNLNRDTLIKSFPDPYDVLTSSKLARDEFIACIGFFINLQQNEHIHQLRINLNHSKYAIRNFTRIFVEFCNTRTYFELLAENLKKYTA
ncbi:hypothetical protein WICMUC_001629 [Wickerhamomyces mucosus]|uniref:Uncharacterized protein n=1 Tax=Wickerhamomyces mucosus TaxID=1378264 RepID=A0A9P8TGW5_9ASCO|nr:hypothetical protein WICMUC_001629 [Wickerhamomyces mucosus]